MNLNEGVSSSSSELTIRLKVELFIADHDGYCSGGDNEDYSKFEYIKIRVTTEQLVFLNNNRKFLNQALWYDDYVTEPKLNEEGSGYCELSPSGRKHTFDVIVRCIEVLDCDCDCKSDYSVDANDLCASVLKAINRGV